MLCSSCHFIPLEPLTLRMDRAKSLDVLTSLPVSHAILPRALCFATSRPANHAICSFIDSSGYASRPIRGCLFIDYIIKTVTIFCCIILVIFQAYCTINIIINIQLHHSICQAFIRRVPVESGKKKCTVVINQLLKLSILKHF